MSAWAGPWLAGPSDWRGRLGNRAAGSPVEPLVVAGHEGLIYQGAAQGAVVVEDGAEDLVDGGLGIVAAGLERLRPLVQQQQAAAALGGDRRDPATADKRTQLIRWVSEEFLSVTGHRGQYDGGRGQLATVIPQAVPFRAWHATTMTCASPTSSQITPMTSRRGGSGRSTSGSRPSP